MPFIPAIVKLLNAHRVKQIDYFRKNPEEVQYQLLTKLVKTAVPTEWGRKYDFSSIGSYRDFQLRVPVMSYEDFEPYIYRMRKGEKNIAWPGRNKMVCKKFGNYIIKKQIYSYNQGIAWECHYQAAKDILTLYAINNPGTKVFTGKALTLGGSNKINMLENKSIYGDLSAVLIWNAPFYIEFVRTPRQEIALIDDFEQKLELITRETVSQNVTSFSGVPSWYLTLIKHILAYTGKSNLLEVWPNLEVFFHGGISFTPYREIYKKLIPGDQMHYLETYNASEGFFGIQDDPARTDMLLMLDYGIFYEFIPADRLKSGETKPCSLAEVKEGLNYALVISTNGGLWRYLIGDTIIFTSTSPYRFRISGRTKHFINAFGEEVIVDNADKALEAACKGTGR
jgi:hypothetical protein